MRILEIILAEDDRQALDQLLDEERIITSWQYKSADGLMVFKLLVQDIYAKELLATIDEAKQDFRVILYPIEGTLPKVTEEDKQEEDKIHVGKFFTISKEELYSDIDEPVQLTANFVLMVILSSFVAGIGILKDNIAIVIGAMVIAPFLNPNLSLAFGTTLGDWPIVRKSLLTLGVAIAISLLIAVLWGMFAPDVESLARDQEVALRDVLLALACGFAGVITAVSGQGATLVGVMVAAALLPPLIRGGLLLGGASYEAALNSFLIFSANVICVNIAGIVTFYSAGIRPQNWWEKERAKKHLRRAVVIWTIALAFLIGGIVLLHRLSSGE